MSSSGTPRRKHWPHPSCPEVRLIVGLRQRVAGRLDLSVEDPPEDPTLAQVVAAAAPHLDADGWLLGGGEPTLRPDLPALVGALADAGAPRLGLITDGLLLANPGVAAALVARGLKRVRIRLHSSQADAHDWLEGQRGGWRRAVKAVRACAAAGLETEIACTITRPTVPHLEETVELFARLGVKGVFFRRPVARGSEHDIGVAPRWAELGPHLEAAVQTGVRRGMRMIVHGFPTCMSPALAPYFLPVGSVVHALPVEAPWPFLRPRVEAPTSAPGCPRCPGPPACAGPGIDYVERFGRDEVDSLDAPRSNPGKVPPTPLAGGDVRPPPRDGRVPPTRVEFPQIAARLPSLGGDPLVMYARQPVGSMLRFVFVAPSRVGVPHLGDRPGPAAPETTRRARIRLVKAAQHGVKRLRIASAGSLAHPEAGALLREATRLEFDIIEVAGEASALDDMTDIQLRRLRGLTRLDVALYGPDADTHDAVMGRPGAFDATMRGLDRLGTLVPNIRIGAYAILDGPAHLRAFAEAWDFGDLPGDPQFRLSPGGGDLDALAAAAAELSEGPARDAIASVLPVALLPRSGVRPAEQATAAWGDLPSALAAPSGSDRFGCYTYRPPSADEAVVDACPGYAAGWRSKEVSVDVAGTGAAT